MATATIETTATGEVLRHHCPRCSGAIAAEHVHHGRWRRVLYAGQAGFKRTVRIWCDHCEGSFKIIERRPA